MVYKSGAHPNPQTFVALRIITGAPRYITNDLQIKTVEGHSKLRYERFHAKFAPKIIPLIRIVSINRITDDPLAD